ncbi:peptidase S9 [Akanthomyces lecanii RCEF 1005]|uniref:Peptidase S9 n=1 Tax=Akanthomyces lecanii RCEF 1005 TaxID=1081108 RepID=A0A168JDA9_CORDF|nr:peptidase S9 [Akanthomyces lecanii RCEF 1005]
MERLYAAFVLTSLRNCSLPSMDTNVDDLCNGDQHKCLFNLEDGERKAQIKKGEWNVHFIGHVDGKNRQLWVRALGIIPYEDPYYAPLVSVIFDGSMLRAGNGEGVVIVRQKQLSLDMVGKWRPVEHFNAPVDAGFPDRIGWIRAAARSRPSMDFSRVGCYGDSAGGHNAAAAVIHHADFNKAAVAGAGSHDNRLGTFLWSEIVMGYPVDASYERCSHVTHAHKLMDALMLCVGGLDHNVDLSSTVRPGAQAD